jgi:hypothetical protein
MEALYKGVGKAKKLENKTVKKALKVDIVVI